MALQRAAVQERLLPPAELHARPRSAGSILGMPKWLKQGSGSKTSPVSAAMRFPQEEAALQAHLPREAFKGIRVSTLLPSRGSFSSTARYWLSSRVQELGRPVSGLP